MAQQHSGRATRAEIDLDALAANVRCFIGLAAPRAGVMAVVKANAYGHGATMVARCAVEAGASWLGVATVDEGLSLRAAGLAAPILVLAPSDPSEAPAAVGAGLTLAVGDLTLAAAVAAAARESVATVHIEIDTGMHRFGVDYRAAPALIARIAALPGLRIGGLYTHYATADEADQLFRREQQRRFAGVVAAVRAAGCEVPLLHQENSAAVLTGPDATSTLIRPGIALYGLAPSTEVSGAGLLRPVLSLRSRVARVIDLEPGDSVSYGRTFVADRALRAALVPIGYADGYRRALSGRGEMLIGGCRAPVLGRVCMDQTVVAIPDGVTVTAGDEVVMIGTQGDEQITAEDMAACAGTINYEIVTGISARVPRWYRRDGRLEAM